MIELKDVSFQYENSDISTRSTMRRWSFAFTSASSMA